MIIAVMTNKTPQVTSKTFTGLTYSLFHPPVECQTKCHICKRVNKHEYEYKCNNKKTKKKQKKQQKNKQKPKKQKKYKSDRFVSAMRPLRSLTAR